MILFQFPGQVLAKSWYTIHLSKGATIITSRYYRAGDSIVYSKFGAEIRIPKSDVARITDEKLNEVYPGDSVSNLFDKRKPVTTSVPDGQGKVEKEGDGTIEACRRKVMQYELLSRRTCNRCEEMKKLRMEIYSDKNSTPSNKLKADQEYNKACDGCKRYEDRFKQYQNQCGGK